MRIFVHIEPVDFRNGIDGLAGLCRSRLQQNPMSGAVFLFINRRRTSMKLGEIQRISGGSRLTSKDDFGKHYRFSESINFTESSLTTVTSLRQQGRQVVDFLEHALKSFRTGMVAPSLLPIPSG